MSIIDIITTHPIRVAGTVCVSIYFIGMLGMGNKFTEWMIKPLIISGLIFILTMIWNMP